MEGESAGSASTGKQGRLAPLSGWVCGSPANPDQTHPWSFEFLFRYLRPNFYVEKVVSIVFLEDIVSLFPYEVPEGE